MEGFALKFDFVPSHYLEVSDKATHDPDKGKHGEDPANRFAYFFKGGPFELHKAADCIHNQSLIDGLKYKVPYHRSFHACSESLNLNVFASLGQVYKR
jgi:hypothetical protein